MPQTCISKVGSQMSGEPVACMFLMFVTKYKQWNIYCFCA